MFISTADTTMSSLFRDKKNGENIGIISENKPINGLVINLGCVITTFNHYARQFQHHRGCSQAVETIPKIYHNRKALQK